MTQHTDMSMFYKNVHQ